jgi:hypothetical protein
MDWRIGLESNDGRKERKKEGDKYRDIEKDGKE